MRPDKLYMDVNQQMIVDWYLEMYGKLQWESEKLHHIPHCYLHHQYLIRLIPSESYDIAPIQYTGQGYRSRVGNMSRSSVGYADPHSWVLARVFIYPGQKQYVFYDVLFLGPIWYELVHFLISLAAFPHPWLRVMVTLWKDTCVRVTHVRVDSDVLSWEART